MEESVGALLLAGFIPGALSAVIYAALIVFRCKLNPTLGAPVSAVPLGEKVRSLGGASGIFFVIIIILGGIYTGWMTPTEVGGVAAFVIFLIALAKRNMGLSNLRESLMETAKLTVFIFTIIWSILIYVRFLGFSGLPEAFANFVVGL
ncbi:MAG: TRAP transporter large permease subunit, partial [Alphaproteobacteria bacterium]|nr:TRAP transporter large permease subunit [Alphaproteobacteria bacterium]